MRASSKTTCKISKAVALSRILERINPEDGWLSVNQICLRIESTRPSDPTFPIKDPVYLSMDTLVSEGIFLKRKSKLSGEVSFCRNDVSNLDSKSIKLIQETQRASYEIPCPREE